jgi:hypothetical protein
MSFILIAIKLSNPSNITDYSEATFYLLLGTVGIYLGYNFVKYGQAKK